MTKEEKKPETGNSLKLVTTTLKDLGAQLPLGFLDSHGGYARDIVFRPWRFAEEKQLGKLRADNESASLGQFVTMVIATMCTRIGLHDLDKMQPIERQVIVSQMWKIGRAHV